MPRCLVRPRFIREPPRGVTVSPGRSGPATSRSCNFDRHSEREYYAIRHSVGLFDATPLFKYEVTGRDAGKLLARVWTRDINQLREGRVTYGAMCDEHGKMLDDGTIAHIRPNHFRVATSEPALHWLSRHARRMDVQVEESTERIGCLALQGPLARDVLRTIVDFDIDTMAFFSVRHCYLSGVSVWLSRTGYTGDLGFEIWVENDSALRVWDAVVEAGVPYGLEPMGLDALDVSRIEAGFILQGVDYVSARHCQIESRKSSPFDAGLGFCGQDGSRAIHRASSVGQRAWRGFEVGPGGHRNLMAGTGEVARVRRHPASPCADRLS